MERLNKFLRFTGLPDKIKNFIYSPSLEEINKTKKRNLYKTGFILVKLAKISNQHRHKYKHEITL